MSRRLLLDTHVVIWAATDGTRLPKSVQETLLSDVEISISVASVWEMAIKKSLGKLEMDIPLNAFFQGQLKALRARLLPIKASHALAVEHFPFHHRDPFDRLLVAQALTEDLELVSADPFFDAYPVARLWG